jgi:hypothetical protein
MSSVDMINSTSVQEVVRGGHKVDLYYMDKANLFIQERGTLANTKFKQAFISLNSSTNQFIFSPDQGLTDVIAVMNLDSANASNLVNYALQKGWGYDFISQIAVRYGGSSQYFWTGEQMLLQNMMDMQDAVSRDFLYQLGGEALYGINPNSNPAGQNDFASDNNWAYIYINLPHNSPNGNGGKPSPLPTELLRQPVLVQLTLKDVNTCFSANSTATSQRAPGNVLKTAFFQVRQVRMINSSDLITAHHDVNSISYTLPLKYFAQQEYQIQFPEASLSNKQVNLTGFRNGGVRSILLWLTNNDDIQPAGGAGPRVYNPNNWYNPQYVVMSVNGEIFYDAEAESSLLLDLVDNKQPNRVAMTKTALLGGSLIPVPNGFTSQYVKMDFAQAHDAVFGNSMLIKGKAITNSIVNLKFSTPAGVVSATGWTLHAVYLYNSSLVFAGGNCEYTF